MSEDNFYMGETGGRGRRGRGRPTLQEIILKLTHRNEDLKKENAELRARFADHYFAMSIPHGGA